MPQLDEEMLIQQLIQFYRWGFEEILRRIIEKEAKKQAVRYWRDLLKEVYEILQQLDTETKEWVEQVVGQVYTKASAETRTYLQGLDFATKVDPNFTQIHQRAINAIASSMIMSMHDSFQFIGRRIDDEFRRIALEEAGRKMASGTTINDMKQRLIQRLLDQGQTAFVDKLGRKWRLDSYAEMVARTTTREAASAATINTCREAGLDLVKITTHYPTCEKCAPLQGKVFSISGQDKRYPKLTDEYRPPIHPNCRHSLQPYVRELDPDADKVQEYSNTSLTKDPRSEKEKQAYKEMRDAVTIQTTRRRAREVLYNEQAPLIERLKAAEKLKKSYEKVGDKINNIDKHYLNGLDKYLANLNINNIVKIDVESGIITIKGTANKSTKAFPNAVIDLINPKLNKIIQRRLYDEKGNARIDIDLTDHNKPWAHDVPHVHEWIDGKRSKKWRKPTEQEKEFIKDIMGGDDV